MYEIQKHFFATNIFYIYTSFVNAQTVLYVRGNEGQFVQKVSFNETYFWVKVSKSISIVRISIFLEIKNVFQKKILIY